MKFCIVSVYKYQCHTMDVPKTGNGVMKTKQRNGKEVTDRATGGPSVILEFLWEK